MTPEDIIESRVSVDPSYAIAYAILSFVKTLNRMHDQHEASLAKAEAEAAESHRQFEEHFKEKK